MVILFQLEAEVFMPLLCIKLIKLIGKIYFSFFILLLLIAIRKCDLWIYLFFEMF